MQKIFAVSVLALLATGCGGADTNTRSQNDTMNGADESMPSGSGTDESAQAQTPASDVPSDACISTMTRQRDCQDEFLPKLVDARVVADVPPGIADRDAELGREALLAKAREEYAGDSTDAAIAKSCDSIKASVEPEDYDRLTQAANACLAMAECGEFSSCSVEMVKSMWAR